MNYKGGSERRSLPLHPRPVAGERSDWRTFLTDVRPGELQVNKYKYEIQQQHWKGKIYLPCLFFLRIFVHPFGVQTFASASIGNENNPFFICPGRPTSSQGREEVNTFWVPPSVQGDSKNISSNFVDPKYHWEWFECKATTPQLHETPKKQDILVHHIFF